MHMWRIVFRIVHRYDDSVKATNLGHKADNAKKRCKSTTYFSNLKGSIAFSLLAWLKIWILNEQIGRSQKDRKGYYC